MPRDLAMFLLGQFGDTHATPHPVFDMKP